MLLSAIFESDDVCTHSNITGETPGRYLKSLRGKREQKSRSVQLRLFLCKTEVLNFQLPQHLHQPFTLCTGDFATGGVTGVAHDAFLQTDQPVGEVKRR